MTDDDICGAECGDGSKCEHPAGSCPVASHSDSDADNEQGRPSKLAERGDAVLEAAKKGVTIKGCARAAGIDESTLHRWIEKYDDFAEEFRKARHKGELKHIDNVGEGGSQFILERSFGYIKREEFDLDVDADVNNTHDVTADFVTFDTDDSEDDDDT